MPLVKAIIEIDASDRGPNLPPIIPVQFNPSEYTLTKGAQIAEIAIPGIDAPILQFVRGQTQTLSMELFFETTQMGMGEAPVLDVRTLTEPVFQLVKIQAKTHAPPRVRFSWGLGLSFRAIVDSIQQKFTLFKRGETLALIAYQEYGDSTEWRRIFEEPRNLQLIPDPRRLQPGLEIVIPSIPTTSSTGGTA